MPDSKGEEKKEMGDCDGGANEEQTKKNSCVDDAAKDVEKGGLGYITNKKPQDGKEGGEELNSKQQHEEQEQEQEQQVGEGASENEKKDPGNTSTNSNTKTSHNSGSSIPNNNNNNNNDDEDDSDDDEEKKKKKAAELKKLYDNWPLNNIKEPHENDVLYGRGGGTNHHLGNKRYRRMVDDRKVDYVNSKRLDKPMVALDIIRKWRAQMPPGRFLKLDEKTGLWDDVGDKKAREKTSQALREKAPEIRRKQEEDAMAKVRAENGGKNPADGLGFKAPRYGIDTKDPTKRPAGLVRDHPMGHEYMSPGQTMPIDGAMWDGRQRGMQGYGPTGPYTTRGVPLGSSLPHYRPTNYGSMSPHPPPPGAHDYYSNMQQQDPQRYGSWNRLAPPPPPPTGPPMSPSVYARHRGSSVVAPPPHRPATYSGMPSPSMAPHNPMMARDGPMGTAHMGAAPIDHQGYDQRGYDQRSGYWGSQPSMPPHTTHSPPSQHYSGHQRYRSQASQHHPSQPSNLVEQLPPPPPPMQPVPHSPVMPHSSAVPQSPVPGYAHGPHYGPIDAYHVPPSRAPVYDPNASPLPETESPMASPPPAAAAAAVVAGGPHSMPSTHGHGSSMAPSMPTPMTVPRPRGVYDIDSNLAQSWARQQPDTADDYAKVADMFGNEIQNTPAIHNLMITASAGKSSKTSELRRPEMVKRMTSNQNEDVETKRNLQGSSIKRATLSRDSSAAAARLKEIQCPDLPKKPFMPEQEMNMLSNTMEQSTIRHEQPTNLIAKPGPLTSGKRSSTIEALSNGLDISEETPPVSSTLPRPPTLRIEGRLSTAEYLDIVNEPLGFDESEIRMKPIEPAVSEWLQQGQ